MIHKLYSLVDTEVKPKEPLYIKGVNRRSGDIILLNKGEVLDFTTYFNSVSLKKWKRYTTIEKLQLVLHLKGIFRLLFICMMKIKLFIQLKWRQMALFLHILFLWMT